MLSHRIQCNSLLVVNRELVAQQTFFPYFHAALSKYLKHSEATSSRYYDFSAIEQSARNRDVVVNLLRDTSEPTLTIDSRSNSTVPVESDDCLDAVSTDSQLTTSLLSQLKNNRPVTINAHLPTLDDARCIITNTSFTIECFTHP